MGVIEKNIDADEIQQSDVKNIDAHFADWFGKSKAVNDDGKPIILYHSTFNTFSQFKETTDYLLGFHVGTLESAQSRISAKQDECERDGIPLSGEPQILALYIRAENPLRLDENRTGRWGADDILKAVFEKAEKTGVPGITAADIEAFYDDATKIRGNVWGDPYRELSDNDFVRKWLQSKKYDSIVYSNEFEGGGDSYLLLEPSQLKSATANGGLFNRDNPDIFDGEKPNKSSKKHFSPR